MDKSISNAYKRGLGNIKGRLMGSHQHIAVRWMLQQELKTPIKGGVLALDMGLGKTYVTIATVLSNTLPRTLIVTPISILHQWRDILLKFGGINVFILDRNIDIVSLPDDISYVLTTYSTFTHKPKKGLPPVLMNTLWDRVILDEGHVIKNSKGSTFQNIQLVNSHIRWILSATPLQNSMKDMMSIARFIGWRDKDIDNFMIQKVYRVTIEQEGVLNDRMKLPKLQTHVVKLQFKTRREQDVYNTIEKEYNTLISTDIDGTIKLETEQLQGILRCRQACCHPSLVCNKRVYEESTKITYICDDIVQNIKEKSLVFCVWRKEISLIREALTERG